MITVVVATAAAAAVAKRTLADLLIWNQKIKITHSRQPCLNCHEYSISLKLINQKTKFKKLALMLFAANVMQNGLRCVSRPFGFQTWRNLLTRGINWYLQRGKKSISRKRMSLQNGYMLLRTTYLTQLKEDHRSVNTVSTSVKAKTDTLHSLVPRRKTKYS